MDFENITHFKGNKMTDRSLDMEAKRARARQEYRVLLGSIGNLTGKEISELVGYEFDGLSSAEEEVRRYFLKLKHCKPHRAEDMLAEIKPYLREGVNSGNVRILCDVISRYTSTFVIHHDGVTYNVDEEGIWTS